MAWKVCVSHFGDPVSLRPVVITDQVSASAPKPCRRYSSRN